MTGCCEAYPGADGMKTGYTEASGHNLVTSAVHSGVRLIGVVLGAASNPERDAHMAMLLERGVRADGCAAGAADQRGEPPAQPGLHRACGDPGPTDEAGVPSDDILRRLGYPGRQLRQREDSA